MNIDVIWVSVKSIALYMIELVATVYSFHEIKRSAAFRDVHRVTQAFKNRSVVLKVSEALQLFSIQKLHHKFTFKIFGTEKVDNTLICSVSF